MKHRLEEKVLTNVGYQSGRSSLIRSAELCTLPNAHQVIPGEQLHLAYL